MPTDVIIELSRLKLRGRPKDKDRKGEPNMWALFFKFDGARMKLDSNLALAGNTRATTQMRPQGPTHESFRGAVIRADQEISIPPELGRWEQQLVDIEVPPDVELPPLIPDLPDDIEGPLDDILDQLPGPGPVNGGGRPRPRADSGPPTLVAPVAGVVWALLEWDFSSDTTMDTARDAFQDAISEILNEQVIAGVNARGLTLAGHSEEQQRAIAEEVERKVSDAALVAVVRNLDLGSVRDPDDVLGTGLAVFTNLQLRERQRTFRARYTNTKTKNRGDYEVIGHAEAV